MIDFPASPTNGQIFQDPTSGRRYIWNSSVGAWQIYEVLKHGDLGYPGKSYFDSMQWTFNNTSTNGWYVRGGGVWEMGDPAGALVQLNGTTSFTLRALGPLGAHESDLVGTPTGGLTWTIDGVGNNILHTGNFGAQIVTTTTASQTPSPGSGAFTSATATVTLERITGTRFYRVQVQITITTNGTAGSFINVPLGITAGKECVLAGRCAAVSGKMVQGIVPASTGTLTVLAYDNTYPGASGERITLDGIVYV